MYINSGYLHNSLLDFKDKSKGKGHFFLNGKEEIIEAGHMILYKPREMQRYVYYGTDQTEVYWVHFTGNNVKNILREYHLFESGQIIQTGNST